MLHCQEGMAVPYVPAPHQGPNFHRSTWPWGLRSLCQEKGSIMYKPSGGAVSVLSLCSLKCLSCQILTGTKERSSSREWLSHHSHNSALGVQQGQWTGRRDVWGCNRGAPKAQKKPSLSATGFPGMPGALTLDSADAVRSWALASQVVGGKKESISLPCYEGIRLCWVKEDLWPPYKAIHGDSTEPAAANSIKLRKQELFGIGC